MIKNINHIYLQFKYYLDHEEVSSEERGNREIIKQHIQKFIDSYKPYYDEFREGLFHKHTSDVNMKTTHSRVITGDKNEKWLGKKNLKTSDWINAYIFKEYLIENAIFKENSERIANKVYDETKKIAENINHGDHTGKWAIRGQVFGNIQQGKTTNYCMLINRAIDMGYKIIVVNTGMSSLLRQQTQEEIDLAVVGYDSRPNGEGSIGVCKECVMLDGKKYKKETKISSITSFQASEKGDPGDMKANMTNGMVEDGVTLIVTKKNTDILENNLNFFKNEIKKNPDIANFPMLYIDDEADQASIDTSKPESETPTTINAKTRLILDLFDRTSYVGYSATPFANAFITRKPQKFKNIQKVKKVNEDGSVKRKNGKIVYEELTRTLRDPSDLFPDNFCYALEVPSTYWGAREVFIVKNEMDDDEQRMDVIPRLYLPQVQPIEDLYKNKPNDLNDDLSWFSAKANTDAKYVPLYRKEKKIPPSLEEAVDSFILNICIRKFRNQENEHNTMLIHTSHRTNMHSQVRGQVQEYLDALITEIESNSKPTFEKFKVLLDKKYRAIQKEFNKVIDDEMPIGWGKIKEYADITPWNKIKEEIHVALLKIRVATFNSEKDSQTLSSFYHKKSGSNLIAVGANKLNRGIVLKGLSVSYFRRNAKTADTLMQMGRFFGYRPQYMDLCRIYLDKEILHNFRSSSLITEKYREEIIDLSNDDEKTPADVGIKIMYSPEIMITRPNAMYHVEMVEANYSNRTESINKFVKGDPEMIKNHKLISNLFENKDLFEKYNVNNKNNICFNKIESKYIIDFLTKYKVHKFDNLIWNSEKIIHFIKEQNEIGNLDYWDLAFNGKKIINEDFNLELKINSVIRTIYPQERQGWQYDPINNCYYHARGTWGLPSDEMIGLSKDQVNNALEKTKKYLEDKEKKIYEANKITVKDDEKKKLKKDHDEKIKKIQNKTTPRREDLRNQRGNNGMLLFTLLRINIEDSPGETIDTIGVSIHIPHFDHANSSYFRGV
ncbi:Z1 domain-containing protein [Pelagibacterales bacterium]|nr:Z1 domain-containing protein [Pelagibacterales bacterium]